ncbi:MAG: hypothetical protein KAI22_05390 [Gammaproteobacteria bacterium]|nr:hypothetical protein [Gammaproteobacteria bacterium]
MACITSQPALLLSGAYNTPQGYIYVFNGSAASSPLAWDTDNNDNNLYIEISDAGGIEPAAG